MPAELIIALDVPEAAAMGPIVDALPRQIQWYKVGLEAFTAEGPRALDPLRERGKSIFLDLKLHDIPRTVARAVRSAARHGAGLITVHASGGREMLRAAAQAARDCGPGGPRILAVTVLTSLDATDLEAMGIRRTPSEQVLSLARLALEAGADGWVCSVQEAAGLRAAFGAGPLLVTPGIRLPDDALGDQKRVGTPADAIRAGATHLVVGRPVLDAADPAKAARTLLDAIR